MRRLILLILVLIGLLLSIPIPAQAQSADNPYIYYFLDKRSAFVIERADGTDTRLLGEGLMPRGVNRVDGPGWSPSGKWFAWRAEAVGAYGHVGWGKSYLIRSDGQVSPLLDGVKDAKMVWSPHQDLLLVTSETDENDHVSHRLIALIDPASNRKIVVKDATFLNPSSEASNLLPFWIDDQHAVVQSFTTKRLGFLITDTNGRFSEEYFLAPTYNGYLSLSEQGNLAYQREKELIVENVITGQRNSFQKATNDQVTWFNWSPSGDYALLGGKHLWLLSLPNNELYVLKEQFPASITYHIPYDQPLWSPDSTHALLASKTDIYHISTASRTVEKLPSFGQGQGDQLGWSWHNGAEVLMYFEQPSNRHRQEIFAIMNFDTNQSRQLSFDSTEFYPYLLPNLPQLSSDGRYLAYMQDGLVIYDRQTATKQFYRPAAAAYMTLTGGEVAWHRDGNWLFTFDEGLVAGGGPCCYHIGIVRPDGTNRRDLSYILHHPLSFAAVGWLPIQVNLSYLPRPLSKPLYSSPRNVLKGDRWWFQLLWSPDGKQVAGIDEGRWTSDGGTSVVWNPETGQSSVAFKKVDSTHYMRWIREPDGAYRLTLEASSTLPPLAISPNGEQQVEYNDAWGVFTVKTGKMVIQIGEDNNYFTSASFSPDGQLLVLGGPYQPAIILDTHSWRKVAELRFPAPAVAFSPDGKYLAATNSWDVNIWKVSDLLAQDSF